MTIEASPFSTVSTLRRLYGRVRPHRQWLRNFAGVFDEKLRDRAKRPVLQGDDTKCNAGN